MNKLFRAKTKVNSTQPIPTAKEFVDWYEAETEAQARELWAEDCHRYGLPMDRTTVVFDERDPKTLKPVKPQ